MHAMYQRILIHIWANISLRLDMRAKTRKCNHSTNSSTLRHVNTHIHTHTWISTRTRTRMHTTHTQTRKRKRPIHARKRMSTTTFSNPRTEPCILSEKKTNKKTHITRLPLFIGLKPIKLTNNRHSLSSHISPDSRCKQTGSYRDISTRSWTRKIMLRRIMRLIYTVKYQPILTFIYVLLHVEKRALPQNIWFKNGIIEDENPQMA